MSDIPPDPDLQKSLLPKGDSIDGSFGPDVVPPATLATNEFQKEYLQETAKGLGLAALIGGALIAPEAIAPGVARALQFFRGAQTAKKIVDAVEGKAPPTEGQLTAPEQTGVPAKLNEPTVPATTQTGRMLRPTDSGDIIPPKTSAGDTRIKITDDPYTAMRKVSEDNPEADTVIGRMAENKAMRGGRESIDNSMLDVTWNLDETGITGSRLVKLFEHLGGDAKTTMPTQPNITAARKLNEFVDELKQRIGSRQISRSQVITAIDNLRPGQTIEVTGTKLLPQ